MLMWGCRPCGSVSPTPRSQKQVCLKVFPRCLSSSLPERAGVPCRTVRACGKSAKRPNCSGLHRCQHAERTPKHTCMRRHGH
eukprot:11560426-Alexandrium_andersonii.AAC.1